MIPYYLGSSRDLRLWKTKIIKIPSGVSLDSHILSYLGESPPFGQETKHVETEHVKIDRAHFPVHFLCTVKFAREHYCGSPSGDPVVRFTQKKSSTFVGISVDIFLYTPVCIVVSAFAREFVGQI